MLTDSAITQGPPVAAVTKEEFRQFQDWSENVDFVDLLPLSLRLDGKPFNIQQARPMFAPLFRRKPIAKRQIFLCGRQIGKALALDTPIPTPSGWTTMGEVQVGDEVLDDQGCATKVLFATDPMEGRPCYRIIFDDKSEVIADEEHLWKVSRNRNDRSRHGKPRIVTTLGLIELQPKSKRGPRFSIEAVAPLDLPPVEVPIPPFLLGYWLGDGRCSDGRIFFGQEDYEESFSRLQRYWPRWGKESIDQRTGVVARCALGLMPLLRKLGVLDNKHIPLQYMRSCKKQRLELLQGLMDSDGSVRKGGGCDNTQKNQKLATDLRELLSTLGIKNRIAPKPIDGTIYWVVGFATTLPVFRLRRKARHHALETSGNPKNTRHYIKSIESIPSVPVRCIEVDSPNHLFLAGRSMIPTHNTASAAGFCTMNTTWRQGFRILYVAPLQLYVTRFHHIYMAKMLRHWQMPWEIQDKHSINNVAEKTFVTDSHFHGVSCFNSAGNALGIPADAVVMDEVQDLNLDFLPQILETLGVSDFGYELYFGTARGVENTIQKIFDQSSQSEFAVKCPACGYWNIPCKDQDALTMIQPHGIACARCSRLLDVESGQWVHAYPDRVTDFVGWHVPQTIVKARICPHDRYLEKIYNKLHGVRKYSLAKFHNEVMGISVEMGSSPISPQQIRDASNLDFGATKSFRMGEYAGFGGGVDWGGSEQTSFTVGTLIGWHRSGVFHVLNAIRPTGVPENERHLPIAHFFAQNFRQRGGILPSIFADGEFVGRVQNKNLQQVGQVPVGSVHYGTIKRLYIAHPNNQFIVDRTTILYIVFSLVKAGLLRFPMGDGFATFTEDLKAVYIEEVETPRGTIQRYQRYASQADDFLHTLGYALLSCSIPLGIDLAEMVGLDPGGSITRSYIETIGEEMPIMPY